MQVRILPPQPVNIHWPAVMSDRQAERVYCKLPNCTRLRTRADRGKSGLCERHRIERKNDNCEEKPGLKAPPGHEHCNRTKQGIECYIVNPRDINEIREIARYNPKAALAIAIAQGATEPTIRWCRTRADMRVEEDRRRGIAARERARQAGWRVGAGQRWSMHDGRPVLLSGDMGNEERPRPVSGAFLRLLRLR